ncbi:hypothetical protein LguiA_033292 [Lonicera macranthoides]
MGNPRNMAELGVSPKEMGRPLFNFAAFKKQELKAMLQKDLMIFIDRLKAKENVSSLIHYVPQQKKGGRKKKITKKHKRKASNSAHKCLS